jgi:hypothetical protein
MKTRQRRVFRGGLRFVLSAGPAVFARARQARGCDQLDDAGNASLGGVSPTVEESVLRTSHADLTPFDAFPAARYVASLAMVASACLSYPRDGVPLALSAHGKVTA